MCYNVVRFNVKEDAMKKFNDLELQKRYDKIASSKLYEIYENFLGYCKKNGFIIDGKLRAENGGLSIFKSIAEIKGYVLGMVANVRNKEILLVNEKNIVFGFRSKASKPLFRKKRRMTFQTIEGMGNIESFWNTQGFGFEMDLYGWYYFLERKISIEDLFNRLKHGETVEKIYSEISSIGNRDVRIDVEGEMLPPEKACEKKGVNVRTFYRRMKSAKDKSRQEVFDELVEARGCISIKGKWYISVSDEDKEALHLFALDNNTTTSECLHKILQEKLSVYNYE